MVDRRIERGLQCARLDALIDPTQQPFALRRLALDGVSATPNVVAVASDSGGVTLRNVYTERDERRRDVGLIVFAGHRRAQAALGLELAATRVGFKVVAVGDGLAPRTLLDAVAKGARASASV